MRTPLRIALLAAALGLASPPATAAPDPDVAEARERIERNAKETFKQQQRESALKALGRIGGPEAAEVVASVLEDPYHHIRDHAVSAFVEMLEGARKDETRDWLGKKALADRRVGVRRGAALALGEAGGKAAAPWLAEAVEKERDASVVEALADALALTGDASHAPSLSKALGHGDGRAAGAAARALGRLAPAPETVATLQKALAHREPLARAGAVDGLAAAAPEALAAAADAVAGDASDEPRIALAEALGVLGEKGHRPAALSALSRLLDAPAWRVRAAAYEGALLLWDKQAVPALVAAYRKEKGRLLRDARRALTNLTGEDLGTDADLWDAWWKTKGQEVDLGRRPKPNRWGLVRRGKAGAAPPSGAEGDTKTVSFFRMPIDSGRMAFLFDFSGSMRNSVEEGSKGVPEDEDSTGEGPKKPAPGAKPAPAKPGAVLTKVQLARQEFAKTARALGKDSAYDVFIYRYLSGYPPSPKMERALGRITTGGEETARRASAWLADTDPMGWGAIYDGLVACAAEEVDTVVLLSDGVPSRGTYERDWRLLAEFPKANRFRRVAVDTVLVGKKGSDREFMSSLADSTGGRFTDATVASGSSAPK